MLGGAGEECGRIPLVGDLAELLFRKLGVEKGEDCKCEDRKKWMNRIDAIARRKSKEWLNRLDAKLRARFKKG